MHTNEVWPQTVCVCVCAWQVHSRTLLWSAARVREAPVRQLARQSVSQTVSPRLLASFSSSSSWTSQQRTSGNSLKAESPCVCSCVEGTDSAQEHVVRPFDHLAKGLQTGAIFVLSRTCSGCCYNWSWREALNRKRVVKWWNERDEKWWWHKWLTRR